MKKRVLTFALLFALISTSMSLFAADRAKCSRVNGVQLGVITYSYRSMPNQNLEDILDYVVASGISSVELMGDVVEKHMGLPEVDKKDSEGIARAWRGNLCMTKAKEIRQMFESRGVKIHILKLGKVNWSDEEIDYAFEVCKALGAKGLTMEISDAAAARYAPFAEKHQTYVIFHNHLQAKDPKFSYEKALSYNKYMLINFDLGHYYAATGINPCRFIERMHKRIFSLHLKDKTGKFHAEPNVNHPFGKGTTPLAEVLCLVRDKQYPIFCDIELEYPVPAGSDAVKEVSRCIEYCKNALK